MRPHSASAAGAASAWRFKAAIACAAVVCAAASGALRGPDAPPPPPSTPAPTAAAASARSPLAPSGGQRLFVTLLLNGLYKTYKKHGADPCTTLTSAAAQGLRVDVHGWGLPAHNVTRERIVLIERYLRQYDDDDVLLFADAGDTIFYEGEEALLRRWRRLRRPGMALFSAEQFCLGALGEGLWPARTLGPYHCLNTGGFIGRAADLRRVYARLLRMFHERRGLALYLEDQNFLYTQWREWKLHELIHLDNSTDIWLSMYQDRGFGWGGKKAASMSAEKRWRYCSHDLFAPGFTPPPRPPKLQLPLRNRRTGGEPGLVHFNGPAKLCWPNFLSVLPRVPPPPRGAMLRLSRGDEGSTLVETPLARICPRAAA